jgi:DNA polymerase I-like protein with 3'-5' exonuclease and polymerase domains
VAAPLDQAQLHLVRSLEDAWACQRWAGERRTTPLCFDTESGGLSPWRDSHRLTQLGDKYHGWAFPPEWFGAANQILAGYQGELCAFNTPYDWLVLAVNDGLRLPWHKLHDALLMGHIKDSVKTAKLKPRSALEIDPRAMAGEAVLEDGMRRQGWNWATVPVSWEPYWCYGALDPVLTAWLWEKFSPEVMGTFRASYDLERATARICAGMMEAGMLVDVPFVERKIAEITEFVARGMKWLRDEYFLTSVNSNEQVGAVLNAAGVPTLVWTNSGMPAIGKEVLKTYAALYPHAAQLIKTIALCRKGSDLVGKYLSKFLLLKGPDDVIHCSIWSSRARTTRMSVTDPPMQTYDRDTPVVRGSYIPHGGSALVTIDADQIEARLAAHCSRDPRMIADFQRADAERLKFFILAASKIYNREIGKADPEYTWTKNATYGQIYGGGLEKIAKTAGVPLSQMRPVYEGFQSLYPNVGKLMNYLINSNKQQRGRRPQVRTLGGRRLYADRGHEYALLNYMIQGSAAEILKRGLINLDAAGLGPYLRLPVHDEIVFEVPKNDSEAVLREAERILTDRESFAVDITWSGNVLEERWVKT